MAFTPCTKNVTKNIVPDCLVPRIKGWERTGVGMLRRDIDFSTAVVTDGAAAFTLVATKKTFAIFNKKTNPLPFNGTQVTANNEAEGFDKQIQFYYEGFGKDANAVIKALQADEFVVVLERKQKTADSFPVFGYEVGLTLESAEYSEETGYWLVTMKTTEHSPEIVLSATDYDNGKSQFDSLISLSV